MSSRVSAVAYWTFVVLLCAFGMPGIFSIGAPFLLLGLTLIAVGPWRHKRTVFWPVVVGVLCFSTGYILVAPLGCTTTAISSTDPLSKSQTFCDNALGIDYSGSGNYNPPLWPATIAAFVSAGVGGATVRVALRYRAG